VLAALSPASESTNAVVPTSSLMLRNPAAIDASVPSNPSIPPKAVSVMFRADP
jgi:hypothetical protein